MEIQPVSYSTVSNSWSGRASAPKSSNIKHQLAQLAQLAWQMPEDVRPGVFSSISDAENSLSGLDEAGLKELAEKLKRIQKAMEDLIMQQLMIKAVGGGYTEEDQEDDESVDMLSDVQASAQKAAVDTQTQKLLALLYDSPLGYDQRIRQKQESDIQDALSKMLGLNSGG